MLSPDQRAQVREAAVAAYQRDVGRFKEAGAVLSETAGGWVNAEFMIGGETLPTLRFPKANLADERWTQGTLRNLDASIVKAQIKAEIAAAVAELPL